MKAIQWYIGCSGFYYKEWKEVFYPKGLAATKWFEYYCQQFNTIEINNTFYRFPELKNLINWYNKAPDSFIFSVKVPQIITHQKKFSGTSGLLNEFYDVLLNGFREKQGPVLFQLPPQLHYSEDKLKAILEQVDPSFQNVIEFRHISWWRKEVQEELSNRNITFCGVSFPGLIDDPVFNTPLCYYRFHGVPKLYYSAYDTAFLHQVVTRITEERAVKTAFIYFNNTAEAAALDNAKFVQDVTQKTAS